MFDFSAISSDAMREIVGACQTPIVVLLLFSAIFATGCLGSLIAEYFTEHRHFRVFLPKLVDELMATGANPRAVVEQSGLLLRQKRYLIELTRHTDISATARESLAVGLEYREQSRYDGIVKITDLTARIAPMLGLLGTLIPLGPGLEALGTGDTAMLSASLLIAFDTTSLGLMVAGVTLIVSAVRNRWYRNYMVSFDAAMEWVLEILAHPAVPEADAADAAADESGLAPGPAPGLAPGLAARTASVAAFADAAAADGAFADGAFADAAAADAVAAASDAVEVSER
jgi:biopolymer transport protein ExbB/TolQ